MIWIASKLFVVVVLAVFAECLLRFRSRPGNAFMAWYGIMLVMLLPPMVTIPLVPIAEPDGFETRLEMKPQEVKEFPGDDFLTLDNGANRHADETTTPMPSAEGLSIPAGVSGVKSTQSRQRRRHSENLGSSETDFTPSVSYSLQTVAYASLGVVWIVGCLYLLVIRVRELVSLSRLINLAEPASKDLQMGLDRAAFKMGCRDVPELVLVSGKFSPLLWQSVFGRSRIVVPTELAESLTASALETIYIHELVHYRRRDGFRRWIEIVVTSMWWWFPIVWLAQKRLRQLEELCTDAEVIRISPNALRLYAKTLLAAEEFTDVCLSRRVKLAPTFVGEHPLKSRIESIMNGKYLGLTKYGKTLQAMIIALILPIGILTAGSHPQLEQDQEETPTIPKSEIKVKWKKVLASPSFGGAAVADIDDDGRLEIAFGTYFGDNSVRVLNAEDGSEYWRFDAGNACLDASLRFADLDKDNQLELVVPVSNLGWILTFDAKTGDEKWRYSPSPVECTDTPPSIVDLDSDGELDVIYGTFKGNLHVLSQQGKRKAVHHPTNDFIQTGPLAKDVNGDGQLDLICATFKGDNTVYAVDGKTSKTLWSFEVPGKHVGMYHGPSYGDINQDGVFDIVFGAYDGKVYCLDSKTGTQQWQYDTQDSFIMSPTVMADLTDDGRSEVIVASEFVTVLDSRGRKLWSKRCAKEGDSVTRGASVADLNGDGRLDIATLSGGGLFRTFDGISGELICEFDAGSETEQRLAFSSHGVTIADMTGDGKLDVFFVVGATQPEKHGLAVCLSGFQGTGRGWYMLRHDVTNTGNIETKLDESLLSRIENLVPKATAIATPVRPPRVVSKPKQKATLHQAMRAVSREELFKLAAKRGVDKSVLEEALLFGDDFGKHQLKGFRAVCLLIETGNHKGTHCHKLLEATWSEEGVAELVELSKRDSLPNYGLWTALRTLGNSESPQVRDYLFERLKTEQDAGLFMSIAQALGQMHDGESVDMVGQQIMRFADQWSGVEPHLLSAIHEMDSKSALPWLKKYLRHEKASQFVAPVMYISQNDREAAIRISNDLLRRPSLNAYERKWLEDFSNQE